jgi:hypothetical protein
MPARIPQGSGENLLSTSMTYNEPSKEKGTNAIGASFVQNE